MPSQEGRKEIPVTDSQLFKGYIKKLASSGLPTCKARLEMLAGMQRSEAFQWYQENVLPNAKPKAERKARKSTSVSDFVAGILADDEPVESVVEVVAKATPKASDDDGLREFSEGMWARYGVELHKGKPVIGSEFKTKRGNTLKVVAVERQDGRRVLVARVK